MVFVVLKRRQVISSIPAPLDRYDDLYDAKKSTMSPPYFLSNNTNKAFKAPIIAIKATVPIAGNHYRALLQ